MTLAPIGKAIAIILCQQGLYDIDPLRIQRLSTGGLAGTSVPIRGIVLIAFLAMQVGVNPCAFPSPIFLSGFMGSLPIVLGIPPQAGERERESGRRLRSCDG